MAFLGKLLSAILKVGAVADREAVIDMNVFRAYGEDFSAMTPVGKEQKATMMKPFFLILVGSLSLLTLMGIMIARRNKLKQLNGGTIEEGEEQLMPIGNAAEANRGNDPVVFQQNQSVIEANSHRRDFLYTFETKCNLRTRFALFNFLLEIPSAVFDQNASENKPNYVLIVMLMSIASMVFCLVELVYKARKSKITWRWSSERIPWFYYPPPTINRPFGTFTEMIGLSCAIAQCIVTTINYYFCRRDHSTPIKMSVSPMIFAFGVLYSNFMATTNDEDGGETRADQEGGNVALIQADVDQPTPA